MFRGSFDDGPVVIAGVAGFPERARPSPAGSRGTWQSAPIPRTALSARGCDRNRPGRRRVPARGARSRAAQSMHSPRSRLCTVLSEITALKLLSGNGSLTALPRCSRPITSGSQCMRAYSEISSPKASRPGHALIRSLTRKPFAAADIENAVAGLEIEVLRPCPRRPESSGRRSDNRRSHICGVHRNRARRIGARSR